MAKNKQFRKEMKALTKRLDTINVHATDSSEYIQGYDHAVVVINRLIKDKLEATK